MTAKIFNLLMENGISLEFIPSTCTIHGDGFIMEPSIRLHLVKFVNTIKHSCAYELSPAMYTDLKEGLLDHIIIDLITKLNSHA